MVQISDPRFGVLLRELREQRGLSLRRLGARVHCSHGHLWDLEHGHKRPSAAVAALLDEALGAAGRLAGLVPSADTAVAIGARWADAPLERGFDPGAFLPPALRWLTAPVDGGTPSGGGTRTVGEPDLAMLRQMLEVYRTADNQFGGGHIRVRITRFLQHDVGELLAGRYDSRTGAELLTVAAEATQLAAWATYDTGAHGQAQQYMIQALNLAGAAGDRVLGAEILAAMSHQAAHLHAAAEAVDLARTAGRAAAEAGVGAIQAEAAVLEAQGHAVAGDGAASAGALDRAERLFDRAERGSDPRWLGYFDHAYLSARFGQTFAALGRGDLALPFAERSLDMDGRYARGRQFNLALVARAHVQTGEVEQGAAVAMQAAEAAEGLASSRARDYLAEIADRLAPHAGLEPVAAYRARVRELAAV